MSEHCELCWQILTHFFETSRARLGQASARDGCVAEASRALVLYATQALPLAPLGSTLQMLPDPLFDILRIYATLQSPKLILTPDVSFESAHAFLLDHVLLNHHFGEYPPSKQYQLTFWKWAIGWLERLASDEACNN